jgi:Ca2+-transporting ATPase
LSIAAVVSLGLGFYQSFRPNASNKVQWVEGVAILVAIVVITVAQALNDYQQERKFMKLNQKVFRSFKHPFTRIERKS